MTFLEGNNNVKAKVFLAFVRDEKKMEIVGFLTDMMSHFNDLNVKLQGEKRTIFDLITAIRAFQKKLEIFEHDIQSNLIHFLSLLKQGKGKKDNRYVQFIDKLINNFTVRFSDFSLGKYLLLFIKNPFLVTDIATFSAEAKDICKWIDAAKVQLELIEFQENVVMKESFCNCTPEKFWLEKVSSNNFLILTKLAVHILTMFGSTYCCESAFSNMNFIRNKFRSCMTDQHLHHSLRLATITLEPRFKELASDKKCHFSHKLKQNNK